MPHETCPENDQSEKQTIRDAACKNVWGAVRGGGSKNKATAVSGNLGRFTSLTQGMRPLRERRYGAHQAHIRYTLDNDVFKAYEVGQ